MNLTFTLLLHALMSFSTVCFGQMGSDYFIVVSANAAELNLINGVWHKIGKADTLKAGNQLKVLSGGNLSLFCSCGKELQINTPGIYQVSDFLMKDESSFDIYGDFTSNDKSRKIAEDHKNETYQFDRTGHPIRIYLPSKEHSEIFLPFVWILWEKQTKYESFVVRVMNVSGEELAAYDIFENKMKLNLLDERFVNERKLLVKVSSLKDLKIESQTSVLTILSTEERKSIVANFEFIKSESSIDKFVMAGFFEDRGLFIDALTYLEDAANQSPNVFAYKEARDTFIKRHGL